MLLSTWASAAILTWDPGATPSSPSGGSGTWDTTTSNWSNGTSDVAWPNTILDTAVFAGAAGTVTLGNTITLNAITFQTSGYMLTAGTLLFGGTNSAINLSAGFGETIASNISNASSNSVPTINGASGSSLLLSGAVGGGNGASITVGGGGTVTLGGAADNSFLGATVNSGTTLVLAKTNSASGHALGSNVTVNSGGTLQLAGAGGDQIFYQSNVTLASGSTFDLNGRSEGFNSLIGTNTTTAIVTNTAASTTSTLEVGDNGGGSTFAGTLQDGAGVLAFTKTGAGTVTLSNAANAYSGVTTLSGGTLSVGTLANGGTASSIGNSSSAAANLAFNGGTLSYTGSSVSTDRNFTVNSNGGTINVPTAGTTLTITGGSTLGGVLTISGAGAVYFGGTLTNNNLSVTSGGTATLGGTADNSSLSSTIAGTLILAKTSTGTIHALGGSTTINGTGTLQLAGTGNDQIYDGVVITMNSGSTFDLNGRSETVGSVGGTGTVTDTSATAGTLTLGGFSKSSDVTNVLLQDGAGKLNLVTGATTTLGLANTYTGVTTINGTANAPVLANGGTASSIGASSNAAANLVLSGGGILNYTGGSVTTDRNLTVGSFGGAINVATAGVTLGFAGATSGSTLTANGPGALAFSGAVGGSSGAAINVSGGGTVTLGGTTDNGYLGATVTSGTLVLNKTSTSNFHALGGSTTVNGGTLQLAGSGGDQIYSGVTVTLTSGVFDLNGQSEGFSSLNLTGTGISSGGALINSSTSASSTMTAPVTLTGDASVGGAGNLTIASVVGGSGFGLTKVGAGTLTLSAANTYTGATVVSNGTLKVDNNGTTKGNITGSSAANSIQVNTGGTLLLSGSGTGDRIGNTTGTTLGSGVFAVTGGAKEGTATTVSGGNINTGSTNAVGLGALTLSSSSTLDFGSGSTGNQLVFMSFSVTSGTLSIINWDNANYNASTTTSGQSMDDRLLFNQQLTQAQLNAIDFGSGAGVNVSQISLGNGFYEIGGIVAVPEPATWLGGGLMMLLGASVYMRRIRQVEARVGI